MWIARLRTFATALWWGSLSTLGLLVVPMLFMKLPTPVAAGSMAAQLFSAQTWVSVGCGLALLLCLKRNTAEAQDRSAPLATMLIVAGLLLALLVEFAVAPRIVARENLRLWHGVGSAMYLGQWFCAAALLWLLPTQQNMSGDSAIVLSDAIAPQLRSECCASVHDVASRGTAGPAPPGRWRRPRSGAGDSRPKGAKPGGAFNPVAS